jgi:N6-adenosine-specific RNA methylase IME4/ParB-like chromosome segregation protein Spo0J
VQIKISEIQINLEYEALVPRVTAEEYQTMKESIKLHGIREPIVINPQKIIIDGHTRFQIAKELALKEVPYREEQYESLYAEKMTVIELNLHRRQLNTAQKCELGLKVLEFTTEEAKERNKFKLPEKGEKGFKQIKSKIKNNEFQLGSNITTKLEIERLDDKITKPLTKAIDDVMSNLIPSTDFTNIFDKDQAYMDWKQARNVEILSDPQKRKEWEEKIKQTSNNEKKEMGKAIEQAAEKVGVSASTLQHYKKMTEVAKTNPTLEKERQEAIRGTKSVNKVFNSAKQIEKREDKKVQLQARKLPEDKFEVIYADPPWEYEFSETEKRSLDNQYPQMHLDDICKLPINTTDDAILFLWTTSPKLEEGLKVLKSWGFTYKTNMVWIKDKIGMGYYARQRHELLLIGTKGKIGVPDPKDRPDSVIESPRDEHSKKPDLYELIERMYPYRRYIELFARQKDRKNWTYWGNEV